MKKARRRSLLPRLTAKVLRAGDIAVEGTAIFCNLMYHGLPVLQRLLLGFPGGSFYTGTQPRFTGRPFQVPVPGSYSLVLGIFLALFAPGSASQLVGMVFMNAYCVILCRLPFVNPMHYPNTKRFYLRALNADWAIRTAMDENRQWRVIGIEPSELFARVPESDHTRPTPDVWHAA